MSQESEPAPHIKNCISFPNVLLCYQLYQLSGKCSPVSAEDCSMSRVWDYMSQNALPNKRRDPTLLARNDATVPALSTRGKRLHLHTPILWPKKELHNEYFYISLWVFHIIQGQHACYVPLMPGPFFPSNWQLTPGHFYGGSFFLLLTDHFFSLLLDHWHRAFVPLTDYCLFVLPLGLRILIMTPAVGGTIATFAMWTYNFLLRPCCVPIPLSQSLFDNKVT